MNISIENYVYKLSSCDYSGETITLGYEFNFAEKILSDKDFDTHISDTIMHEFIHGILTKSFDLTTSKLFDAVGHLFEDIKIVDKVFRAIRKQRNSNVPMTWHDSITTEGFDIFLQDYHIDNIDLIQAYIITGGK